MAISKEFENIAKRAEVRARRLEGEVLRGYKVTLEDLYQSLGQLYRQYEDKDGKLTYEEMSRYKRLEKMAMEFQKNVATLYGQNDKAIYKGLREIYEAGYKDTAGLIRSATGKRISGIVRKDVLDRAITNDISGLAWTERMGVHRGHAVAKIRETVTQGLHDGSTYRQMAKRLNEALSGDVVNPIRIVRTESHRVISEAQKDRLDEAEKSGVKMVKVWVSSKDERVRSSHVAMDGVSVPYKDDFVMPDGARGFAPGIIGAPQHDINCRCSWKIEFVDA